MKRCCIVGCPNNNSTYASKSELTFHKFPSRRNRSEEVILAWYRFCGPRVRRDCLVCDDHFAPEHFVAYFDGDGRISNATVAKKFNRKVRLLPTAVPTAVPTVRPPCPQCPLFPDEPQRECSICRPPPMMHSMPANFYDPKKTDNVISDETDETPIIDDVISFHEIESNTAEQIVRMLSETPDPPDTPRTPDIHSAENGANRERNILHNDIHSLKSEIEFYREECRKLRQEQADSLEVDSLQKQRKEIRSYYRRVTKRFSQKQILKLASNRGNWSEDELKMALYLSTLRKPNMPNI